MKLYKKICYQCIIISIVLTIICCDDDTEEFEKNIRNALNDLNISISDHSTISKEMFRSVFKKVMGSENNDEDDKILEKMTNIFMKDIPEEIHLHNISEYFDSGKILKAFTGILGDLNLNLSDISFENLFGNNIESEEDREEYKEVYDFIKSGIDEIQNEKEKENTPEHQNEDL